MQKDERDLLEVLKFEPKFLEDAGNGGTTKGTHLFQKQHAKCANPACPTAFRWTEGGKFFRFRPDAVSPDNKEPTADLPAGVHCVRHYWLCGRCSHFFTLVHDPQYGVVLKVLSPELLESVGLYKKASAA